MPREIEYLENFDKSFIDSKEVIDMPDHELKQLLTYIIGNEGSLSARKKNRFFEDLPSDVQNIIEDIVRVNFGF